MHWCVREVPEPRHLVSDLHPVHWQFGQKTMLLHLTRDHVRVELRDEACWAVVLYYLNNALRHLFVLQNVFFEIVCIKPLDLG